MSTKTLTSTVSLRLTGLSYGFKISTHPLRKTLEKYDRLILRALRLPSFICKTGTQVYFWDRNGDWITATLNKPDNQAHIKFHISNVLKIYNHLNGDLIFSHDNRTNL